MNKLLLLHGPNLNLLGKRSREHYGPLNLSQLEALTRQEAAGYGVEMLAYQSNHEGVLIDILQREAPHCLGLIINPGALSHTSYALHDALIDSQLAAIEVHLSDIHQREAWRRHSVTAEACLYQISGKKQQGYLEAVQRLMTHLGIQGPA